LSFRLWFLKYAFTGKPLLTIHSRPMILWVCQRAALFAETILYCHGWYSYCPNLYRRGFWGGWPAVTMRQVLIVWRSRCWGWSDEGYRHQYARRWTFGTAALLRASQRRWCNDNDSVLAAYYKSRLGIIAFERSSMKSRSRCNRQYQQQRYCTQSFADSLLIETALATALALKANEERLRHQTLIGIWGLFAFWVITADLSTGRRPAGTAGSLEQLRVENSYHVTIADAQTTATSGVDTQRI
jgi:hypothetical protein